MERDHSDDRNRELPWLWLLFLKVLPIVATISLAKGLKTLASKNALVNKLSSVETLGATSVICTDETGTLTENLMTATQVHLFERTIDVNGDSGKAFAEEEKPWILKEKRTLSLHWKLE
ncbi:MAG: hypothetical protein U5K71_04965 [Gracilimonas sp.]|nr:hypothetical protein [Gracilimonas sp.]